MKNSLTKGSAIGAATTLAALSGCLWSTPTYASSSTTLVGQGAYLCESKPVGLPYETYNVTLRISLNAPASVSPGQTVSLSGTATLQLPEKAYQEGKQVGETEADGFSDTLSIATSVNGRTTDVHANRWQTAPFPWSDPAVISAPITIQPFTVPANASGPITFSLPRNERAAPNTASSSPATVAFNGVANNKTAIGNVAENLGCYLQGTPPTVMGSIPVITSGSSTGARSTVATTSAPASRTGGVSTPSTASVGNPSASGGSAQIGAGPVSPAEQPTAGSNGGTPVTVGTASGVAPTWNQVGYTAGSTRSGVFISTNVLIIGGGLICVVALAYAALTGYRLRTIKKAMDG